VTEIDLFRNAGGDDPPRLLRGLIPTRFDGGLYVRRFVAIVT
jgi:hypothetical protein